MPLARAAANAPGALFQRLLNEYRRTHRQSGNGWHMTVELGGLRIRLAFAQSGLKQLADRLMGHLRLAPDFPPDLRVYCWQGEHSSKEVDIGPQSGIFDQLDPQTRLRCNRDGLQWERELATGTEILLDISQRRALYRLSPGPGIAFAEQAALMRPLLVSWTAVRGLIPAHAAAVGTGGRGVLLAGGGGCGKTTTALRCLLQGMDFAGDDRVVVQADPPRVWSLYGSAKIGRESMHLLPELRGRVHFESSVPSEKGLLYLESGWRDRMIRSFSLRALVLPRTGEPWSGSLKPVGAGEALRTLAPSTLFSQSRDGRKVFLQMATLVRRIPAYQLSLGGANPAQSAAIPRMIEEVL